MTASNTFLSARELHVVVLFSNRLTSGRAIDDGPRVLNAYGFISLNAPGSLFAAHNVDKHLLDACSMKQADLLISIFIFPDSRSKPHQYLPLGIALSIEVFCNEGDRVVFFLITLRQNLNSVTEEWRIGTVRRQQNVNRGKSEAGGVF
jgi:hypothetical protein